MAAKGVADGLNAQQEKAVGCDGSVLVLAGAGTGKTRTLIARVQRLLDDGAEPSSIVAVTYTNKAAREMRGRLASYDWSMFVGTFHSYCRRVLQRLGHRLQVMDTEDQYALMRRVVRDRLGLPTERKGGPKVQLYCRRVSALKERGVRAAEFMADDEFRRAYRDHATFAPAYEEYEKLARRENKADFAELLLRCCEELEADRKARDEVVAGISHILVDELQDINPLQMHLLTLLRDRRIWYFGVGDDDQSIYSFRGANPGLMSDFAKRFASSNVVRLERNYRSTDPILALANEVIAGNKRRMGKVLSGVSGTGDEPELRVYESDEQEAFFVARAVMRLLSDGVDPAQVAVLYRNNAQSLLLEQSMAGLDVPFVVRGGIRFYARREIKDAIAYLQAAAVPGDVDAITRSVNMPPRKVGASTLASLLASLEGADDPLGAMRGFGHKGVREYAAVLDAIKAAADAGDLVGAMRAAVEKSGLREHLISHNEDERAENLDEMINAATRHAAGGEGGALEEFLSSVALDQVEEVEGSKVSLLTIHSSKGLEFDHLFVIAIEDDIIPGRADSEEKIAEERRILYVAMTRARRTLNLSYAARRMVRGHVEYMGASSLLPPGLLEGEQGPGKGPGGRGARRQPPRPPAAEGHGYKVGQKITSARFGPGVVLSLADSGERAKAHVLFFRTNKARWLLLAQADLRPSGPRR